MTTMRPASNRPIDSSGSLAFFGRRNHSTSIGAPRSSALNPARAHTVERLRSHAQMERRIALAVIGEEVEEIPLRHQRDELAAGRQVGEIRESKSPTTEICADAAGFLVRQLEELVEQTELAHHVEGRGMDGVAAEVAQEVAVLLEHDDVDARAREQEAEHEPAGPAADDT